MAEPERELTQGRRRALAVLGLAFAVIGLMAILGRTVEDHLKPSTLALPGTQLEAAEDLYVAEFGSGVRMPVLVRGPQDEVESQARALARRLEADERIAVFDPWDLPRSSDVLRPHDDSLVLITQVTTSRSSFEWVMPLFRREIERTVSEPVQAHVTGIMAFGSGFEDASLEAAAKAEKIAMPLLVVILLLVLRTPVAALIPLALGGLAVQVGRGLVRLTADAFPVDAAAVTTVSMMALALGVDYALLMVARFREQLAAGDSPVEAARVARATAGRTVLFASTTLVVAMLLAVLLSPGDLLRSMATGTLAAVAASAALAVVAVPPALVLAGHAVNRFQIGRGGLVGTGRGGSSRTRSGLAVALVTILLLGLAAPSLAIELGPVDPRQLPESVPARSDYEIFEETLGPGWAASLEVVAVSREGVVTERDRFAALARWQRRVAQMDGVQRVLGPASLVAPAQRVRETGDQLRRLDRRMADGVEDTERLAKGLARAGDGVGELRDGIATGAHGAGRLASGTTRADAGAERLADGTTRLADGADRLRAGTVSAEDGAGALGKGLREVRDGTARLLDGARTAAERVRAEALPGAQRLAGGLRAGSEDLARLREPATIAEDRLAKAWAALRDMSVGKADPRYVAALTAVGEAQAAVTGRDPLTGQRVRPGYDGLDAALATGSAELARAADGADRLGAGLETLASGSDRLADGLGRLDRGVAELQDGAAELERGLLRLQDGAGRLATGSRTLGEGGTELGAGLDRLADGAARLAGGLAQGHDRSLPLEAGLHNASTTTRRQIGRVRSASERLHESSREGAQLFISGYAPLAAFDRAAGARREAVEQAVSLDAGGRAARFVVIPSTGPNHPDTARLLDRVRATMPDLERTADVEAGVLGTGTELAEFQRVVSDRFPLIIVALSVVTWMVLVVLFRSLLLPLVAVALNLVTVGAAFGVLALGLELPGSPLGDAGFIDAISAVAIFVVVFGLSIDYEVFLLSRMREGWEREGDTEAAIQYGVSRTAGVIVGAALIMTGVFVAFAAADVANLRQMGVGLAVAVMLDATVIRLFLLPAIMRRLGELNWWLPAWLDRRLPNLATH